MKRDPTLTTNQPSSPAMRVSQPTTAVAMPLIRRQIAKTKGAVHRLLEDRWKLDSLRIAKPEKMGAALIQKVTSVNLTRLPASALIGRKPQTGWKQVDMALPNGSSLSEPEPKRSPFGKDPFMGELFQSFLDQNQPAPLPQAFSAGKTQVPPSKPDAPIADKGPMIHRKVEEIQTGPRNKTQPVRVQPAAAPQTGPSEPAATAQHEGEERHRVVELPQQPVQKQPASLPAAPQSEPQAAPPSQEPARRNRAWKIELPTPDSGNQVAEQADLQRFTAPEEELEPWETEPETAVSPAPPTLENLPGADLSAPGSQPPEDTPTRMLPQSGDPTVDRVFIHPRHSEGAPVQRSPLPSPPPRRDTEPNEPQEDRQVSEPVINAPGAAQPELAVDLPEIQTKPSHPAVNLVSMGDLVLGDPQPPGNPPGNRAPDAVLPVQRSLAPETLDEKSSVKATQPPSPVDNAAQTSTPPWIPEPAPSRPEPTESTPIDKIQRSILPGKFEAESAESAAQENLSSVESGSAAPSAGKAAKPLINTTQPVQGLLDMPVARPDKFSPPSNPKLPGQSQTTSPVPSTPAVQRRLDPSSHSSENPAGPLPADPSILAGTLSNEGIQTQAHAAQDNGPANPRSAMSEITEVTETEDTAPLQMPAVARKTRDNLVVPVGPLPGNEQPPHQPVRPASPIQSEPQSPSSPKPAPEVHPATGNASAAVTHLPEPASEPGFPDVTAPLSDLPSGMPVVNRKVQPGAPAESARPHLSAPPVLPRPGLLIPLAEEPAGDLTRKTDQDTPTGAPDSTPNTPLSLRTAPETNTSPAGTAADRVIDTTPTSMDLVNRKTEQPGTRAPAAAAIVREEAASVLPFQPIAGAGTDAVDLSVTRRQVQPAESLSQPGQASPPTGETAAAVFKPAPPAGQPDREPEPTNPTGHLTLPELGETEAFQPAPLDVIHRKPIEPDQTNSAPATRLDRVIQALSPAESRPGKAKELQSPARDVIHRKLSEIEQPNKGVVSQAPSDRTDVIIPSAGQPAPGMNGVDAPTQVFRKFDSPQAEPAARPVQEAPGPAMPVLQRTATLPEFKEPIIGPGLIRGQAAQTRQVENLPDTAPFKPTGAASTESIELPVVQTRAGPGILPLLRRQAALLRKPGVTGTTTSHPAPDRNKPGPADSTVKVPDLLARPGSVSSAAAQPTLTPGQSPLTAGVEMPIINRPAAAPEFLQRQPMDVVRKTGAAALPRPASTQGAHTETPAQTVSPQKDVTTELVQSLLDSFTPPAPPDGYVQREVTEFMSIQRAVSLGADGIEAAGNAGSAGSASAEDQTPDNPPIDIKALARQIYPLIKRMLAIEKERLTGRSF